MQELPARQVWVPALMLVIGLAAGVVTGALTNAVNGLISPLYFETIMGWDPPFVWLMSIEQGMLEGAVLGLFFGLVVATSFAVSTGLRGPLRLAGGALTRATAVCLICWAIGGSIAVALAATQPSWYASTFVGVPGDPGERARYAWVGGSIWGAYGGTFIAAVVACVWQHLRWRRLRPARAGFPVLLGDGGTR